MADESRERILPDEVTEMILVRLSATDLACYKLVCKRWRSLISSPYFASAHLSRSKSDPSSHHILVQDQTFFRLDSPLPGPFDSFMYCYCRSMLIVVGSINGLICTVGNYHGDDICILNPVTGLSKKLPPSESPLILKVVKITFAFWWDSSTDDYKLVKITSLSDDSSTTLAEVWASSSPDTWSDITVDFCRPFYHDKGRLTYCDVVVEGFGAYWIVVDRNLIELFLLSLDMSTLTLEQISLPHELFAIKAYGSALFGVKWKGGFACVERDYRTSNGATYNLWVLLERHGGSSDACWRKDFSFVVDFPFRRCLNCIDGRLVLQRRGVDGSGVALFDMETNKYEVLRGVASVASAHGFVGSFVSIKGFKPHEEGIVTVKWPYIAADASRRDEFRKKHIEEEKKKKKQTEEEIWTWPSIYSERNTLEKSSSQNHSYMAADLLKQMADLDLLK